MAAEPAGAAIELTVSPAAGRPEELVARARFANEGPAPIAVLAVRLDAPALALEVANDRGEPVPLPPPPVPDPRVPELILEPGEARLVEYRGFLPAWTEPGGYRVRAGWGEARSPWVAVTVTP